jgi:hypothetical protein
MAIIKFSTGFSIELIDCKLVSRGEYKDLPLYESLGGQVTAIALVDEPAIGEKVMGNDSDKTIMGPVMIPDLKMYRNMGPNGPESCYWYFSAETIKELQQGLKVKIKIGH